MERRFSDTTCLGHLNAIGVRWSIAATGSLFCLRRWKGVASAAIFRRETDWRVGVQQLLKFTSVNWTVNISEARAESIIALFSGIGQFSRIFIALTSGELAWARSRNFRVTICFLAISFPLEKGKLARRFAGKDLFRKFDLRALRFCVESITEKLLKKKILNPQYPSHCKLQSCSVVI